MRTLVLNAGYEPMQLISWQRALCLVLAAKAEVIAEHGQKVRTISASFPLPSVVRLKRYVQFVRRFGLVKCTRRNIFLRDHYQCQYCGVHCSQRTVTIDHVVPRSKGGGTTWDNVVTSCSECNLKKGNMSLLESGMRLLSQPRRPTWQELLDDPHDYLDPAWLPYLQLQAG